MTKEIYWNKTISYPIAEDVDLQLYLRIKKGKLKTFSLVFQYNINDEWHLIKRCDNSKVHDGIPHCHLYKMNGPPTLEIVGGKMDNMGVLAETLVKDIKKNYPQIVENYKHAH